MSRVLGFAARFVLIVTVIALAQAVIAPPAPAHNPYDSSLSSLTVGSAYAIPLNCPNNSCGGKKGCRADHGFYCTISGGTCTNSKCN